MKTIIMDTANQYLIIALYQDGKCLDFIQEEGNRRQSEYAIVRLQKLLEINNLTVLDFDEMVITIGPGSYTGVRVALTIAKTIAATTNIKVKTVSSLKAFAGMQRAISILDARSHKVFIGIYDQGHDIIEETIIPIEKIEDYIKLYPDYSLVGDVSLIHQEEKKMNLVEHIYQLSRNGNDVQDVDNLVPCYIKEVEAKKL